MLNDKAETLRIERILGEIAVIGLIIDPDRKVTIRQQKVTNVEISNKSLRGSGGIVSISELSVDEQAVIEKRAIE